jgi:hypothetical protein
VDLRRVDSPPAEKAGTVLKAEAHVARNVLAARGHVRVVVVGVVARSGHIGVGIHRSCGGSEAPVGPGCEGIAFRLATGGASEGHQGAVTGAAGGQARRPVA